MLLFSRIVAQIIDLAVGFAILLAVFLGILPIVAPYVGPGIAALLVMLLFVLLCFGIQYPFLRAHQTIGKAFFALELVSTKPDMPLTLPLLVHREIFCKLMSCYLICLPMLKGKPGGHEAATGIQVVQRQTSRSRAGTSQHRPRKTRVSIKGGEIKK